LRDLEAHSKLVNKYIKFLSFKLGDNIRIFKRHIGCFYTKRGTKITIGNKGQADIWGKLVGGMHFEIEIKTGKGRLTRQQKNWKAICERFGTLHFVGREDNLEDILQTLKDQLQKIGIYGQKKKN